MAHGQEGPGPKPLAALGGGQVGGAVVGARPPHPCGRNTGTNFSTQLWCSRWLVIDSTIRLNNVIIRLIIFNLLVTRLSILHTLWLGARPGPRGRRRGAGWGGREGQNVDPQ